MGRSAKNPRTDSSSELLPVPLPAPAAPPFEVGSVRVFRAPCRESRDAARGGPEPTPCMHSAASVPTRPWQRESTCAQAADIKAARISAGRHFPCFTVGSIFSGEIVFATLQMPCQLEKFRPYFTGHIGAPHSGSISTTSSTPRVFRVSGKIQLRAWLFARCSIWLPPWTDRLN